MTDGVKYIGTRHPDWPVDEKKIFSEKTKQYAEQRKKQYLLKQWGIQDGPHNPLPKEKIKTIHLSEPELKDKKSETKAPELTGVDRYILAKKLGGR